MKPLLIIITVAIALVECKFVYVGKDEEKIEPSPVQYRPISERSEETTTERVQHWQNPSFNHNYPQYGEKINPTTRFPPHYQNNPYLVNSGGHVQPTQFPRPQTVPQHYPTVPNYVASAANIHNSQSLHPTTPKPINHQVSSISYNYQTPQFQAQFPTAQPPQHYHQNPTVPPTINIQNNPFLNPTSPKPFQQQANYEYQPPAFQTVPSQQIPGVIHHIPGGSFINLQNNPTTQRPNFQHQEQSVNYQYQKPAYQNVVNSQNFVPHFPNNPYLNGGHLSEVEVPKNVYVVQEFPKTSTVTSLEFDQGLHTSRPINPQNFGNSPQTVGNNQEPWYYQTSGVTTPNDFSRQEIAKPISIGSSQRESRKNNDETFLNKSNNSYSEEITDDSTYEFASDVQDGINGNSHQRQETRDGATVKGQYSYNDGYVKVTVMYVADDQGYRIIGSEKELVGEGPQHNPEGKAQVATYQNGNQHKYEIREEDLKNRKEIKT